MRISYRRRSAERVCCEEPAEETLRAPAQPAQSCSSEGEASEGAVEAPSENQYGAGPLIMFSRRWR